MKRLFGVRTCVCVFGKRKVRACVAGVKACTGVFLCSLCSCVRVGGCFDNGVWQCLVSSVHYVLCSPERVLGCSRACCDIYVRVSLSLSLVCSMFMIYV